MPPLNIINEPRRIAEWPEPEKEFKKEKKKERQKTPTNTNWIPGRHDRPFNENEKYNYQSVKITFPFLPKKKQRLIFPLLSKLKWG